MTTNVRDHDLDQVPEALDLVQRVIAALQADQIAIRSQEAEALDHEALDLTVAQEAEVELGHNVLAVITVDRLLLDIQAVVTRLREVRAEAAAAQEARMEPTTQENRDTRDDRDQLKVAHLVLAAEVNPTIPDLTLINSNCKLTRSK